MGSTNVFAAVILCYLGFLAGGIYYTVVGSPGYYNGPYTGTLFKTDVTRESDNYYVSESFKYNDGKTCTLIRDTYYPTKHFALNGAAKKKLGTTRDVYVDSIFSYSCVDDVILEYNLTIGIVFLSFVGALTLILLIVLCK